MKLPKITTREDYRKQNPDDDYIWQNPHFKQLPSEADHKVVLREAKEYFEDNDYSEADQTLHDFDKIADFWKNYAEDLYSFLIAEGYKFDEDSKPLKKTYN